MQILVIHSVLGEGMLTNEHSASSYGQPVFVRDLDGLAYGPGDSGGFLSRALDAAYDAGEQAWLDGLLSAPDTPVKWRNRPGRPKGTTKPEDERLERFTVRMTQAEWDRCLEKGNASEYIRGLIAKDGAE